MSKKTLNQKNLAALGAETLAALLVEVTKGNAAAQRRLRLELSAQQGPEDIAHDLRKRLAAIRQAKGRIPRKTRGSFAKELHAQIALIEDRIAPQAPDTAFELLWDMLDLAERIFARIDDHNGVLAEVFGAAMEAMSRIAPRAGRDEAALADTLFDAMMDDPHQVFAKGPEALQQALGDAGMERMKLLAQRAYDMPASDAELARYGTLSSARQRALAQEMRSRLAGRILQRIADLQGDVDGYIARISPEQLLSHVTAPDVAARLLAADRPEEALRLIEKALAKQGTRRMIFGTPELDAAYVDCLTTLGRKEDLKTFLWQDFQQRLNAASLRRYLGLLPEFDDIDAEDEARAHAMAHPGAEAALAFLIDWPDLAAAARLVMDRHAELDAEARELLVPAAEALEAGAPLASTVLRRMVIGEILARGRSGSYDLAADLLRACAASDAAILDYRDHPDHFDFVQALRRSHAGRKVFWARIDAP